MSKEGTESESTKRGKVVPVLMVLVLIAVAVVGFRYWRYAATHVSTDDAYVTGDVITVSPQASGTVKRVLVQDNQHVKAGQLLVVLDDAEYHATVEQAKANLEAAIAQARSAGVAVSLTSATGGAQEAQAEGLVSQADGGVNAAQQDVARADAAVLTAVATAGSAEANVAAVRAAAASAEATRAKAEAGLQAAAAATANAGATARAADAAVDAAKAGFDKAVRDTKRYTALAAEGAVGQQTADNAVTAEDAARAQLQAAKEQASAAKSGISARRAEEEAAKKQVEAAVAAVRQASAQLNAAKSQAEAVRSGIAQAKAQRNSAVAVVRQAAAKRVQAVGQRTQARTTPRQVAISRATEATAIAKIAQARAALNAATINLNYTRIYAPVSGLVNKKTVEPGNLVAAGTPLLAVVPDTDTWVLANLKETQLRGVEPGRAAEVEVDADSGRAFHGHVDSLAAATGATFALLPADNASGNFTKVVQRVPVKIVLDSGQPGLDHLRTGMSVQATIETN